MRRLASSVLLVVIFSSILETPTLAAPSSSELSTISVIQNTISAIPECLHYKVTGVCFWLQCSGPICSVNPTLKVDHYLPDAVASVFRNKDSNPWDFARTVVDPVAYQAGNAQAKGIMGVALGQGNEQASSVHDNDNHLKEVDIIGNPAVALFTGFRQVVLPSTAQPFLPYYTSLTDSYMWRSPLIETLMYPQSLIPGVHIVGSLINNWGNIYPRTGFIIQPADAKAAAVIAQRAADIATSTMQPHVYNPLSKNCGTECQVFDTKENDPNTQWQMVYPNAESKCIVFGENDSTSKTPWNSEATQKGNGNYVWVMWRRYKGCIPGEGKYIGNIKFN